MASLYATRTLFNSCFRCGARQGSLVASVGRVCKPRFGGPVPSATGGRPVRRTLCRSAAEGGGGGGSSGSGKPVGSGGSGEPMKPSGSSNGLWAWYMSCLEANPVLTKSLTCAFLNALGDIFCQLFIERGAWDAKRTGTFTFMGLALVGPTLHFWYSALNKMVPASGLGSTVMQLLLDQGVFAPVFLATFITVLFGIEGKSHMVKAKLQQDLVETVKMNWVLWIPAQFLNFRFVPPNLQVLTANLVALIWNTYMSFQSHKAVAKH